MKTYAEKKDENKGQAVANSLDAQKSNSKPTFQFTDNRPESIQLKKLHQHIEKNLVQRVYTWNPYDPNRPYKGTTTPRSLHPPIHPDGTTVNPNAINMIVNINQYGGPGNFQIIGQWHGLDRLEGWAMERGINNGRVSHFNIRSLSGITYHVYYNLKRQLEIVTLGSAPSGF